MGMFGQKPFSYSPPTGNRTGKKKAKNDSLTMATAQKAMKKKIMGKRTQKSTGKLKSGC